MIDIKKLKIRQQVSTFAQLFLCAMAITLLHRTIAIAIHFKQINFKGTYDPYEGFNQYHAYFLQFGKTIANGLRADLLFCFFLCILLYLVPRRVRILGFALLALFYAGNLEHIRYNMTSFDVGLMGMGLDTTFLFAQITKPFILFFIALTMSAIVTRAFQLISFGRAFSLIVTLIAVPFIIFPLFSINISQPFWMQNHPLVPNMRSASVSTDNIGFSNKPFAQPDFEFYNDKIPSRNLLLVYLEGLSSLSIEKGDMHYLNSLSDKNIHFERYFGHQLITANGLYSTLTGRLPRFIEPDLKWDEIDSTNTSLLDSTIPTQLKHHGYQTSFIQSAPLSFMSKDEILPLLGFDVLIGDEIHPVSQPRGGWGVDDRSLFENLISHIDSLDENRPWMIGVLTTGTHSPYFVPENYLPEAGNDRYRALRYADDAIEQLVESLESRGLLENTVVVITADESRATTGKGSLQDEIALSWLPLVLLAPDTKPLKVSDYTVSSELPELIWTLLDENQNTLPVSDSNDAILFGNIISGRVIWYDTLDKKLFVCDNREFACGVYGNVSDLADLDGIESIKQAYFPQLKRLVLSNE